MLSDEELLKEFKKIDKNIINLKQYFCDTKNPVVLINYDKKDIVRKCFNELLKLRKYFKILIFLDTKNDVNNQYMSVWRITNNIDALRDIYTNRDQICIDATEKSQIDGYEREWPKEVNCSKDVIESLIKRGLIEKDEEFFKKFEIMG